MSSLKEFLSVISIVPFWLNSNSNWARVNSAFSGCRVTIEGAAVPAPPSVIARSGPAFIYSSWLLNGCRLISKLPDQVHKHPHSLYLVSRREHLDRLVQPN